MNHTLTLTGSIAALTAAMAAFEQASGAGTPTMVTPDTVGNLPATQTASTPTGTGTAAQMPHLSEPNGVASIPNAPTPATSPASTTTPSIPAGADDEDDASGGDTDGTGLDADGLPWDARIHTSTKTKTAKGLWTKVRGGPKGAELAAIEAELRAGLTSAPTEQPAAPVPVPPMPIPVAPPVAPPMPTHTAQVDASTLPPPVPMPAAVTPEPVAEQPPVEQPPAATAAEPDEQWDFAKLMQQIGDKIGSQITPETLSQVCGAMGIGSIMDLAPKPELIGDFVARLKTAGVW